ncbi:MAG TPA: hypothetical protein VFA41_24480 [Ktedonobacteraceae bacterium]|nr:hypothetical protein [Ktedonobacteraceae bacterium]
MRSPRPRAISSLAMRPASMVLPMPTSSANKNRWRGADMTCKTGASW